MLAKFSGIESERNASLFTLCRKRKREFVCWVHLLCKAGAWNQEVPYCSHATTAKKCSNIIIYIRPRSDVDLFMSQTWYIELSTWKVWHLNQVEMPISIWNGSALLSTKPVGNFDFRGTLKQLIDSNTELFMRWT